jgi:hypothetical protein
MTPAVLRPVTGLTSSYLVEDMQLDNRTQLLGQLDSHSVNICIWEVELVSHRDADVCMRVFFQATETHLAVSVA